METKAICIRFPEKVILELKNIARQESCKREHDITYSDLIRQAVIEKFNFSPEITNIGERSNEKLSELRKGTNKERT